MQAGRTADFNFFASHPSPDGRWVTEIDWTTGDLAARDLVTGRLHRLTDKGPGEFDGLADGTPGPVPAPGLRELVGWTPDGEFLLYMLRSPSSDSDSWSVEDVDLWRVSRDGARTERVGTIRNYVGGARLHPDGRTLAYRAGRSRGEIWALEDLDPDAAAVDAGGASGLP